MTRTMRAGRRRTQRRGGGKRDFKTGKRGKQKVIDKRTKCDVEEEGMKKRQ